MPIPAAAPDATKTLANDDASRLLRTLGARLTAPRIQVLRALLAAPAPLSHRELLDRLREASAEIDRVTVYRVLDWLVDQGLAQKAADARRTFRFSAADPRLAHESHVHFRCTRCGGVFCLKEAPPPRPRLPRGFRLSRVNVDIEGACAGCAGAAA